MLYSENKGALLMDTIALLRSGMKTAHEWLEATMADVTPEMAQWAPPGTAHPIGSRYAHVVVGEDNLVAMVKGGAPLHTGAWQGRTGIAGDPQAAYASTLEWAQTVKIDLAALRGYAQAVYANTDEFLATLKPENLETQVDLSQFGMGVWQLDAFLLSLVLGHARDIMGEISAVKGVQGAKGYPF
jgi:hypothetical protein